MQMYLLIGDRDFSGCYIREKWNRIVIYHGNLRGPPNATPQEIAGLIKGLLTTHHCPGGSVPLACHEFSGTWGVPYFPT